MHNKIWGNIADDIWLTIPTHHPTVRLDTYIIMPNHIHGIIVLTESGAVKLGTVVGAYKSAVSKNMNLAHNPEKYIIWQRGFYDHIIVYKREYRNIQNYILANPVKW